MEKETRPTVDFKGLVQWATTRPQAYVVYFLCVVLIWGVSFLAGTLSPKRPPPQPTISAPSH